MMTDTPAYESITTPSQARRVVQEALNAGNVGQLRRAAAYAAFSDWHPRRDAALVYFCLYSILELTERTRWKQPRHIPGWVEQELKPSLAMGGMPSAPRRLEANVYDCLVDYGSEPKQAVKHLGEELSTHYIHQAADRLAALLGDAA